MLCAVAYRRVFGDAMPVCTCRPTAAQTSRCTDHPALCFIDVVVPAMVLLLCAQERREAAAAAAAAADDDDQMLPPPAGDAVASAEAGRSGAPEAQLQLHVLPRAFRCVGGTPAKPDLECGGGADNINTGGCSSSSMSSRRVGGGGGGGGGASGAPPAPAGLAAAAAAAAARGVTQHSKDVQLAPLSAPHSSEKLSSGESSDGSLGMDCCDTHAPAEELQIPEEVWGLGFRHSYPTLPSPTTAQPGCPCMCVGGGEGGGVTQPQHCCSCCSSREGCWRSLACAHPAHCSMASCDTAISITTYTTHLMWHMPSLSVAWQGPHHLQSPAIHCHTDPRHTDPFLIPCRQTQRWSLC